MKEMWPHRSIDWIDSGRVEKPIKVPCGKCIPCLVNRRTDWGFRLQQEHKVSKTAFFVTLTYDQKHLRTDGSLCKKDFQDYMKRLRFLDGTNTIRYFAVGEYGSKSLRPHYHALIFNGQEEHIRLAWRDSKSVPIGIVHIGAVTPASVAYTLKYMVQPDIRMDGLEKPFALMSRRYGIGGHYLSDRQVEWHRDGDKNYTLVHGQKGRLPRFYREKIWPAPKSNSVELNERWLRVKERVSESSMKLSLANQEKEISYYKKEYGINWERRMAEFRHASISRVKTKVAYTQKF